ncbi:MAG: AbrB/MazE/SpoVT family DNA-binding domain-containing protein [Alphaproteobacteria bacterium]
MKAKMVKIGNSQGIRIPKAIIDQCGFETEVDLSIRDGALIVAPARPPRAGWEAQFAAMAEAGDDAPLLPDGLSETADDSDWTW